MAVTWRKLVLESDSSWVDLTDGGATTLHKHDHGGQDGLADDDHTGYALLAGRSGGQTLYGGTASGDDLTLESTSSATKGDVLIQPNGGRVGIGVTPSALLHVSKTSGTDNVVTFTGKNGDTIINQWGDFMAMGLNAVAGIEATGVCSFSINNTGTGGKNWRIEQYRTTAIGNLEFNNLTDSYTVPRMVLTAVGNLKVGGAADRATTVGTNHLDIFNGTAPAGTLSNGGSIYASSGELYMMDAAGNATLQTPHDEDGNWIFYSRNTVTGRVLRIDMERMMKAINDRFGWDFVKEYATDVPHQ